MVWDEVFESKGRPKIITSCRMPKRLKGVGKIAFSSQLIQAGVQYKVYSRGDVFLLYPLKTKLQRK